MHISEMRTEVVKKNFLFEIKAFEFVVRNLHIATGILVIESQRVNKQSEDLRLRQTFLSSIYLEFMEK